MGESITPHPVRVRVRKRNELYDRFRATASFGDDSCICPSLIGLAQAGSVRLFYLRPTLKLVLKKMLIALFVTKYMAMSWHVTKCLPQSKKNRNDAGRAHMRLFWAPRPAFRRPSWRFPYHSTGQFDLSRARVIPRSRAVINDGVPFSNHVLAHTHYTYSMCTYTRREDTRRHTYNTTRRQ